MQTTSNALKKLQSELLQSLASTWKLGAESITVSDLVHKCPSARETGKYRAAELECEITCLMCAQLLYRQV